MTELDFVKFRISINALREESDSNSIQDYTCLLVRILCILRIFLYNVGFPIAIYIRKMLLFQVRIYACFSGYSLFAPADRHASKRSMVLLPVLLCRSPKSRSSLYNDSQDDRIVHYPFFH